MLRADNKDPYYAEVGTEAGYIVKSANVADETTARNWLYNQRALIAVKLITGLDVIPKTT